MFAGLDECMEDVMTRFMKGLNYEIQTIVMHEAYKHISHFFCLHVKLKMRFYYIIIQALNM
jgi:hypothetical protein